MSAETTLIDEIVQRVLKELGTAPGAAPSAATAGPAESSTQQAVTFDAQVITREMLETGSGAATHIRVRRGAILTPSARDFLRERHIEITAEPASAAESRRNAARCRVLLTHTTPAVAAALAASHSTGLVDEPRIVGTPAEAATEATSLLCRGEAPRVVIFTNEPELTACLANRNERVRGAALYDLSAIERLRTSLKPNLLASDPAGKSEFELGRMLKAIMGMGG